MRNLVTSAAVLGAVVCVWIPGLGAADEGTSYRIEARLDPVTHTVDGLARIAWRNDSALPASDLFLHLYLNAFAHGDTIFMRESIGAFRGEAARGRGHIEVLSLRTADGVDLLHGARTDLLRHDATQMRLSLREPVAPGRTLRIEARYRAVLPPLAVRSGHSGEFHMVAQFFPKIARREPDGTWAMFPYHALGEFYSDFARYELVVTTPRGWVVGATGSQIAEQSHGQLTTRTFVADRVHDVAFAAWPYFEERVVAASGVHVRVLSPPGYGSAVERHLAVLRTGLLRFGRAFGAYPYDTLTVVVPPRSARGAAGMEYPTLMVTAGPWLTLPGLDAALIDNVTAHELAHQWFQGVVASNEVAWPMLDEGLAEWAGLDLLRALHGEQRSALALPGLSVGGFEAVRAWAADAARRRVAPGLPAYAFDGATYGAAVYGRTALALETVRRVWGRNRFERALRAYATEQRFKHPTPDALFAAFNGVYGHGFSARVLGPLLLEGDATDVRLLHLQSTRSLGRWRTGVVAERTGLLDVPTWVALRQSSGPVVRVRWPAGERLLRVERWGERQVISAEVDPDHALLTDTSLLDNWRTRRPQPTGPSALFAGLLLLGQALIGAAGP